MLRVYITEHCPACATAQLVDIDAPGARVPPQISGTPMYTWGDRVIFRGNPGEQELVARVLALRGVVDGPGAG